MSTLVLPAPHAARTQFMRGALESLALWFLPAALLLKLWWPSSTAPQFLRGLPIALVEFIPFAVVFVLPLALFVAARGNRFRGFGMMSTLLGLVGIMVAFCLHYGIPL